MLFFTKKYFIKFFYVNIFEKLGMWQKMIKISIPSNNILERKYLLDILFHQFLAIDYETIISKEITDSYVISFQNRSIIIKDYFFSLYPNDLEYLHKDSIPKTVIFASHKLFSEENLPILFGQDKIEISSEKIISHIDIFATLFFMLTRWEEYVNKSRDEHQRFPHTASLAYQSDFLHRPIVNEYVEFLWNMLLELGFEGERKKETFSMIITHDIDEILRYPSIKKVIKGMIGDIIYRKNLLLPFKTLYDYALISLKKKNDPYDTFDEIMDISEKFNMQSHFFFMAGGESRYDNRYEISDPLVKTIIEKIKNRGHKIGLHPSYNAYNNPKLFTSEKEQLETIAESKIVSGREHYLRFEVPTTWQIWEDNQFEWCSNLAYAKEAGFRAGSCLPYTPFNILTRETLTLIEKPLTMMEVTFMEQTKKTSEFDALAEYYLKITKKYNGEFVLLWHNATLYERSMLQYKESYQKTIQKFKDLL